MEKIEITVCLRYLLFFTENPEGVCTNERSWMFPWTFSRKFEKKSSFMNVCNHLWMYCKRSITNMVCKLSWMLQNFHEWLQTFMNFHLLQTPSGFSVTCWNTCILVIFTSANYSKNIKVIQFKSENILNFEKK